MLLGRINHDKLKWNWFLPSDEMTRLLAKSALFPTSITAFCAIFCDVHKVCSTRSATLNELLSAEE